MEDVDIIENKLYKKLKSFVLNNEKRCNLSDIFNISSLKIKKKKVCNGDYIWLLDNIDENYINCDDLSFEEYNVNKIKIMCFSDDISLISLSEDLFNYYLQELRKYDDGFVIVLSLELEEYKSIFVTFYKKRLTNDNILLQDLERYEGYAMKVGYIKKK